MPELLCEVRPGMASFSRFAIVKDLEGCQHSIQVDADFLGQHDGHSYLPVGVVYRGPDRVLIEFSHEADTGTYRFWVAPSDLR
jgi:hypothetical protein